MKMNVEIICYDYSEIDSIDFRPALKVFNKVVKPESIEGPIVFGEHYNQHSMANYMKMNKLLWCPLFNNFTKINSVLKAHSMHQQRKLA